MQRSFRFGAVLLLLTLLSTAALGQANNGGDLATSQGPQIKDTDLRNWVNELIPAASPRLYQFTQCYGGNMLDIFKNDTNTVVLSGTKPGEMGVYQGYDRGASAWLRPWENQAGRPPITAHAPHAGGTNTRDVTNETPTVGGGMDKGDFWLNSLKPGMFGEPQPPANGPKSRHVLVWAGRPDNGPGRDTAQRDRIVNNFAGEPNTSVTTVGGDGTGGWQFPGTNVGLRRALEKIKKEIQASGDPSKEQFIFYGGDHGSSYNKSPTPAPPAPVQPEGWWSWIMRGFGLFGDRKDCSADQLLNDPDNVPGFSVFVPFDNSMQYEPGLDPDPFSPGAFTLTALQDGGVTPLNLTGYEIQPFDLDYEDGLMGVIGDRPGEGVYLFFPVGEPDFIDRFFDVENINLTLFNHSTSSLLFDEMVMDTGELAKLGHLEIPEPGSLLLLTVAAMVVTVRRRRAA